jgi:hypothetical protein
MVRIVAGSVALLGVFAIFAGWRWLSPGSDLGYPGVGIGFVVFGLVALYAGISVLRRGRL